jgi:hypothetical protein
MRSLCNVAVIIAALCLGALAPISSAVEPAKGVAPQTQLDVREMLNQLELNVAMKQYEKILTARYEAELERSIGPADSGATGEQKAAWIERSEIRCKVLDDWANRLQEEIRFRVKALNAYAKDKAEAEAEAKASQQRESTSESPALVPSGV